jgi:solute carrier family 50 protein (sugar transporter)
MGDVSTQVIVPLIGVITSTVLALSPFSEVLKADSTRVLGDLNVFPLAMMVPNGAAWLFYAVARSSMWIWCSNFVCFVAGLWYASVMLKCLDLRYRQLLVIQIVIGVGLIVDYLGIMAFIFLQGEQGELIRESITGYLCLLTLVIFYAAPLSTLAKVLRSRDSSAFILPLAVTSALNGFIWSSFGLYSNDPFVYGPNMVGFINGSIQIICCILFPRKVHFKSLLSTSSTDTLFNRNASFGSVATELNFKLDPTKFYVEEAADKSTPVGSPRANDTFITRLRHTSAVSDTV